MRNKYKASRSKPGEWELIQLMRINKSLGEAELGYDKNGREFRSTGNKYSKRPKMQKALSFNQDHYKGKNQSKNSSFKINSNSYNLDDSFKAYKDQKFINKNSSWLYGIVEVTLILIGTQNPSTNRTENNSSNSSPLKRNKVNRIKMKWWTGRSGCSGDLPQTKIKIVMEPLKHLNDHPINIAIRSINNFINHAFKVKSKDDYDIPSILSLGKPLGIIYPKTQIIDHNFLRSREFLSFSKEKILRYLYSAINKSNWNTEPDNSKSLAPFHQNRFYVGKGNNYILVRSVIKQRWWWSMNEREDFFNSNFVWTQWRKNKHLCILDTRKEWK